MSKTDSVLASEGHFNLPWGEVELFTSTVWLTTCATSKLSETIIYMNYMMEQLQDFALYFIHIGIGADIELY